MNIKQTHSDCFNSPVNPEVLYCSRPLQHLLERLNCERSCEVCDQQKLSFVLVIRQSDSLFLDDWLILVFLDRFGDFRPSNIRV